MDYLLVVKNGLGNKIFILANILHRYPKDRFFAVDSKSHHQEGLLEEKVWHLFPLLKEHPRIKFIRWKEYDELKPVATELDVGVDEIFVKLEGKTPTIKKYFKPSSEYDYLQDKYDFKKGIFVHYRLGDKVQINYEQVKKGKPIRFVVLKPEYYTDYILKLRKNDEPVYIFSDSPKEAKCLLNGDYTFVNEGANETFYCFYYAKRVIISESTLSVSAVLLGSKKKDLIVPRFFVSSVHHPVHPLKLVPSPNFSDGVSDESYIVKTLKDYQDLIKKCKIKV